METVSFGINFHQETALSVALIADTVIVRRDSGAKMLWEERW